MIKIASMVGTPDLETPTLAPYSGDLGLAFKKLSALGYEGIELMTKRPASLDGPAVRQLLAANQLVLAGLCTGHIFGEDRLGLVTPEMQIDPRAITRLKEFIDLAAFFGPGTLVNIGRSRLASAIRIEKKPPCRPQQKPSRIFPTMPDPFRCGLSWNRSIARKPGTSIPPRMGWNWCAGSTARISA